MIASACVRGACLFHISMRKLLLVCIFVSTKQIFFSFEKRVEFILCILQTEQKKRVKWSPIQYFAVFFKVPKNIESRSY